MSGKTDALIFQQITIKRRGRYAISVRYHFARQERVRVECLCRLTGNNERYMGSNDWQNQALQYAVV